MWAYDQPLDSRLLAVRLSRISISTPPTSLIAPTHSPHAASAARDGSANSPFFAAKRLSTTVSTTSRRMRLCAGKGPSTQSATWFTDSTAGHFRHGPSYTPDLRDAELGEQRKAKGNGRHPRIQERFRIAGPVTSWTHLNCAENRERARQPEQSSNFWRFSQPGGQPPLLP